MLSTVAHFTLPTRIFFSSGLYFMLLYKLETFNLKNYYYTIFIMVFKITFHLLNIMSTTDTYNEYYRLVEWCIFKLIWCLCRALDHRSYLLFPWIKPSFHIPQVLGDTCWSAASPMNIIVQHVSSHYKAFKAQVYYCCIHSKAVDQ